MNLTDENKAGLGVARNEANLLGIELDVDRQVVAVTFAVLTLPEPGPAPEDRRIQFLLSPTGRVAGIVPG